AGGAVIGLAALRVRVREPAEKRGELAVRPRPEHEMPVVGHQAVGEDAGGVALERELHDTFEGVVILRLVEQRESPDGAVEAGIDDSAGCVAGDARHGKGAYRRAAGGAKKD